MNNVHLEPDLHAAAFLLTKGFPLIRLERVGRRYAFEFSPDAQQAAHDFRSGGTVVARDFAAALTRLKDELYAAKYAENQLYSEKLKDGNGEHGQYPRR